MKNKTFSLLILMFILSINIVFASDVIFDKYGIRKGEKQTLSSQETVVIKSKSDIAVDKEWIVKFNEKMKLRDIFAMSIKKGNEYIPVDVSIIDGKKAKISTWDDYEYGGDYTIYIALLNGRRYTMDFSTIEFAVEPTVAVSIDSVEKYQFRKDGLNDAKIVYQMSVAPGISRYLAIFNVLDYEDDFRIGPVRSARVPFLDLAESEYGGIVHAGGSAESLYAISDSFLIDIDEIYNSSEYFYRVNDSQPPYNLYTNISEMKDAMIKRGLDKNRTKETYFDVGIMPGGDRSYGLRYRFSWYYSYFKWDESEEKYFHEINSRPDFLRTGEPVSTENIALLETNYEEVYVPEPVDENKNIAEVIGSGEAYFYKGGKIWRGTWSKEDSLSNIRYEVDGKPFKFNEGRLWVIFQGE